MRDADNSNAVRVAAITLLGRREHTRLELRKKLQVKYPDEAGAAVDVVLDRLVEEGYLSDGRFAEAYLRYRSSKGFGPIRLARELDERGVPAPIAKAALANFEVANAQWVDLALLVREKKFGAMPVDVQDRARQERFLAYRGFSFEQIAECLREQ